MHVLAWQVGCLAEKTGEDSARLRAPFDLHGSEEHLFGETDLPNDTTLQLEFVCETILVRCYIFSMRQTPEKV